MEDVGEDREEGLRAVKVDKGEDAAEEDGEDLGVRAEGEGFGVEFRRRRGVDGNNRHPFWMFFRRDGCMERQKTSHAEA